VWEQPLYFAAFLVLAQRAFCAATILARPAALNFRLLGLGDNVAAGLLVGLPSNNTALAIWSLLISTSIASMISFVSMSRIILSAMNERTNCRIIWSAVKDSSALTGPSS
jgi:hypothetical protein